MIDQAALQELAGFQAAKKNARVLSLYLNVDPRTRTTESYRLALRHLLESVQGQAAPDDIARVESYVDKEYDRQSRGLAIFSDVSEGLWHALPLMVSLHDTVFVGLRPYLKPLGDVLDISARYGVALVDKEGAQLYVFHLGKLESTANVTGEDVKRHKQGGWAAARYQRHEDATALRNLKEASELIGEFVRDGQVRRLILGGTDANVAQFSTLLSKNAQQAVVGTISADVTANPAEVGEKSLTLIQEIASDRKAKLVNQLITTAAKGGPAALGLSNTLVAVLAGRAYHLILDDEFAAQAVRCDSCGFVDTNEASSGACPLCGEPLRVLPDAADSLVRWAIEQDIELSVVPNNPNLQASGSVGALLRY